MQFRELQLICWKEITMFMSLLMQYLPEVRLEIPAMFFLLPVLVNDVYINHTNIVLHCCTSTSQKETA